MTLLLLGSWASAADPASLPAESASLPAAPGPTPAEPTHAPGSLRRQAEAAELAGEWPAAMGLWEECAQGAPGVEQRRCAARVEILRPQAADEFRGWSTLEAVRRDYRTLGSDVALPRIEAALRAEPEGPAAGELRLWLVNEYTRRGETTKLDAVRSVVQADPALPPAARAWVDRGAEIQGDTTRRRIIAGLCAVPAGLFGLWAARGPGPWLWRSAGVAAALLLGFPAVFAAAWGGGEAPGFLRTGSICTLAVLCAARAPSWIAAPGTLGALGAVAWWNGWFPSMGL